MTDEARIDAGCESCVRCIGVGWPTICEPEIAASSAPFQSRTSTVASTETRGPRLTFKTANWTSTKTTPRRGRAAAAAPVTAMGVGTLYDGVLTSWCREQVMGYATASEHRRCSAHVRVDTMPSGANARPPRMADPRMDLLELLLISLSQPMSKADSEQLTTSRAGRASVRASDHFRRRVSSGGQKGLAS